MTYENKFTDYTGHKLKADVRNFRPDIDTDKKLKMYRDHISNTEARIAQPGYAGVSDGGLPLWRAMLWDTEEAQRIKENDSEFWDEVDERTPPPEDRNAGDIVDIIDTLVKERDHEGPININSNEVTADQANEWETIANIVGNDNVTDYSVDNKTTIDGENIFDVADSEYSDGNAFNGNFSRLDVDQNNKWKTDLGVYGDGNITDASVSNIMDVSNNNSYNGSGFSGWDTNDLIYEPEDTKVNIPENSQLFIDKWINGEKNGWDIPSSDEPQVKDRWQTITDIYGDGNITEFVEGLSSSDDTEPASYIRDASDIGTGFLERFKNKLLTKILDR